MVYPWFSRHWLTIISSTINAWNWGVNYQDGLTTNDFESWIYYIRQLPLILGVLNFGVLTTFLAFRIFNNNIFDKKIIINKKNHILFIIFILNVYFITVFMSTKDIRFFLPIYPIICIYIALILESSNNYFEKLFKKIFVFSLIITLFSYQYYLPINLSGLKNNRKTDSEKWFHKEVINTIKEENPYLISTLAVIPDTREINTFNLEAEATKNGEFVVVRQIMSNEKSYKDDLKYFDWFIIKTGNQGIMNSTSKNK